MPNNMNRIGVNRGVANASASNLSATNGISGWIHVLAGVLFIVGLILGASMQSFLGYLLAGMIAAVYLGPFAFQFLTSFIR